MLLKIKNVPQKRNVLIEKVKAVKTNSDDIYRADYAEQNACRNLTVFIILRRKELFVRHKKYARYTEIEHGIIIHRCGKVKSECGKMRARHSAKGAADAEKAVGRAYTSEYLRKKIKCHNDNRAASRVLCHNGQKFFYREFFHSLRNDQRLQNCIKLGKLALERDRSALGGEEAMRGLARRDGLAL